MEYPLRGVLWSVGLLFALAVPGCQHKTPKGLTPPPRELGIVVEQVDKKGHDPEHCRLSWGTGGADHVRWHNPTSVARTLHFVTDWPFMEPREDIVVPPNGWTPWYTLDVSIKTIPSFPYTCDPKLTDPGGGPDQPSIESGP